MQFFFNDRLLPSNVASVMGTEDKARLYVSSIHSMDKQVLTLDQFMAGYFVVAIDLTPDQSAQSTYQSTEKQGTVRISIRSVSYTHLTLPTTSRV